MWYRVVLLSCGLWGNCLAMNDILTLHKDDPDQNQNRGAVLAAAMVCHNHSKKQEAISADQKQFHTDCLEYLKRYRTDLSSTLLGRDSASLVHGFNNDLVWIFTQNEQRKFVNLQRCIVSQDKTEFLGIDETPGHFVFCSVREGTENSRVMAVDNKRVIHSWWTLLHVEASPVMYEQYAEPIPGTVTAIRQTPQNLQAIFFRDDAGLNGVGLAIGRLNGGFRFIPIDDSSDVTHIKANLHDWHYKVCKADGSARIYRTDQGFEPDGPTDNEKYLRLLTGNEAISAEALFEVENCCIQ